MDYYDKERRNNDVGLRWYFHHLLFTKDVMKYELGYCVLEIIVLTSDSSDDNKGVSSEGPSITSIPKEGPSIARRSKEPILKELLEWYGYDTVEDYLPVAKKPIPKVIFKSPIPNKRCVLGLANVETWDNIVKKYRMRTHERCVDKSKGKRKVSC
ncbi:hypothetical protein Tco_0348742 [Tanacetum coccineum]